MIQNTRRMTCGRMIKILTFLAILVSLFQFRHQAKASESFSGTVLDSSIYGIVVQGLDEAQTIKLFQLRPETRGDRDPHTEDLVEVIYHPDDASGALVAERITVTKRHAHT